MTDFLIVDDSGVVRKVARRILESFDFTCFEAEDGAKALAFCENQRPDAILLDWNMPNMTGIEFIKALKERQGESMPPVIFCTTENDMDFITRAIEAGATEYIMKPFDADILEGKLRQTGILAG